MGERRFYFTFYGGVSRADLSFEEVFGGMPGWKEPIIRPLTEALFFLGWDGGLEQVKEKFGALRFYWNNRLAEGPNREERFYLAEAAVGFAEWLSEQKCFTCGEYGKLRGRGWVYVSCSKHAQHEADLNEYERKQLATKASKEEA